MTGVEHLLGRDRCYKENEDRFTFTSMPRFEGVAVNFVPLVR